MLLTFLCVLDLVASVVLGPFSDQADHTDDAEDQQDQDEDAHQNEEPDPVLKVLSLAVKPDAEHPLAVQDRVRLRKNRGRVSVSCQS